MRKNFRDVSVQISYIMFIWYSRSCSGRMGWPSSSAVLRVWYQGLPWLYVGEEAFWGLLEEAEVSAFKFRWGCGENQEWEQMLKGRDLGASVVHDCLNKGKRSVLGVKQEVEALRHREDPISGHCARHSASSFHLISQHLFEAYVIAPVYMWEYRDMRRGYKLLKVTQGGYLRAQILARF